MVMVPDLYRSNDAGARDADVSTVTILIHGAIYYTHPSGAPRQADLA